MTLRLLNSARATLVVAAGASKAAVLAQVQAERDQPASAPTLPIAMVLRSAPPDRQPLFLIDSAAAARLAGEHAEL